jgi:tRNA 2-thiouridine synthesizing protein A
MELDARGLKCPMPIIRLGAAVRGLAPGQEVTVLADDKGFPPDVRAWCEKTGHTLVSLDEQDPARLTAVVRKAGG